ncbi:hypothetical protein C7Y58_08290 [Fusobacterium nucleatum subsp. nucleatum ATCC 25586]|uniref:Uncharacterized protein n=1 Tax=Fusobacterium nucleatum subsp. nucleatum (strain ATCC 25586 / DSM 15643 / BCRC 10681 / CIP 101130 / JCM 8532 / KCTC 2640 / LMG 13131 / VPI 4355) TaxID=190304 RepID=Q8REP4_FUSNN|nr:hypothetical protein [Fusobacterium nucleatum]AAL95250.1 unknown [Fusobacterium nucleatum subsp. nucleatum ATCC 25586]ALF25510.1 hypothetical protein RN95_03295 [Fusobacterium nucleatum subsp. nucleatum]AVQ15409.1 hypothetical protein C7Y58_08290 [Fusobacterium nucleatum subsp. nucleatum ATCC 25586]WMS30332.1 hypothetical protein RDV57_04510 [Fusobacterium nucleatum]
MRIAMIMMTLVMVIFIICSVALISLLGRKNTMECFYVEDNILYLNSLFVKKISLSDIRNIEFKTFRSRGSYSGKIIVNLKNAKVIKRYFQTSQVAFFVSEQMVLAEIEKITSILKKYYIPYTINK